MKKNHLLFISILLLIPAFAFSQNYAATSIVTNSKGLTKNVIYLDTPILPSNNILQSLSITENVDVIWQKSDDAAIAEQVFYLEKTEKTIVNWDLNNPRVNQFNKVGNIDWTHTPLSSSAVPYMNEEETILLVADGNNLAIINPADGSVINTKTFTYNISAISVFPDGTGFYIAFDEIISAYNIGNLNATIWTSSVESSIVSANTPADNSVLLVCTAQPINKAYIMDPITGNILQELFYYNNSPSQVPGFSANGEYLAIGDFNGHGILYQRVNGVYKQKWIANLSHAGSTSTWGCGTAVSADGSTVAFGTLGFISSGYMGSLFVYNSYSNEPIVEYHEFGDEVCSIAITDDGSLITAASWGSINNTSADVLVFRRQSSTPVSGLSTPGSIFSLKMASDGFIAVAGGKAVHARLMGSGGNAYLFHPVPYEYGAIAGVVDLVGSDSNKDAHITIEGLNDFYTYSAEDGSFNIKYIPAGTYTVVASKQGYFPQSVTNITITEGSTTTVNFTLEATGIPITNLFATQGAYSYVSLTWNEYEGECTGYRIYRKLTEEGPFTSVYNVCYSNYYIDEEVLPTIKYYYAVSAILNGELDSPFSNIALGYTSTSFITKDIDVYEGSVPIIDGIMSPGEWDDAFMVDVSDFLGSDGTFQPVGSVIAYFKMNNDMMYIAVINNNDHTLSSGDRTALYVDDNKDLSYGEPQIDNSEGNYWIDYSPSGTTLQYRPIYSNQGVGTVITMNPLLYPIAASDATGVVVVEFVIPLGGADEEITPNSQNMSGLYMYVRDGAYGNSDGQWPFDNAATFVPTGYGTLHFYCSDDVPPPPENLSYTSYYYNNPEFVAITWDKPNINDLDHFVVNITNTSTNITETFQTYGNQLLYEVEDLTTYIVCAITVDKAGQESVPSEQLSIVVNFAGISKINSSNFIIYPNPIENTFTLQLNQETSGMIEIYNISGYKVSEYRIRGLYTNVNISNLSSGIYFVKADNNVKKIIKK